MPEYELKSVTWISHFPIEWWEGTPTEFRDIPKGHPAVWQRVLLGEFMREHPELEIHIVALRKTFPRSSTYRAQNVTFHLIKTVGGLRAPTLFWYDTYLIGRVLRKVRPQLVHCWGTEWGAPWIAYRLGYPFIVTMQGIITWYCRVSPPKNLYGKLYFGLSQLCERQMLRKAILVTTESKYGVNFLKSEFGLTNVWQAEHPPIKLFFQVERRPRVRPLKFVFVGRASHLKGTDLLLKALDQIVDIADFEIVLIGSREEPFFSELMGKISPKLKGRLVLRDVCTTAEVANELGESTMLLFPTRADTSPNAVKEAAVVGVPVVATRVGGIPDYIIDGKNGVLCEPESVEDFARGIKSALSNPMFSRGAVDPETYKWVRDYLSPERMGQRFWEAYCFAAKKLAGTA